MRGMLQDSARGARPYAARLLKDEDLRDNIERALRSAHTIFAELRRPHAGLGVASRLATDRELQERIQKMAGELKEARRRLEGKEEHTLRNVLLVGAGAAAVFALLRQCRSEGHTATDGR